MTIDHFTKLKLSNGLTIIHAQSAQLQSFEMAMHIDTGSRDETEANSGVSHFLEHMMFRGSRSHPNSVLLAQALEEFGGENNAMTSVENSMYWLRGSNKKLLQAIPAFADFFLFPNYADLEIERSIVLQEMANDFNEEGDLIDVESLAMGSLFAGHPLGLSVIGKKEVVESLSKDSLEEKRALFYIPQKCALVLLSASPWTDIATTIEASFGRDWEYARSSGSRIPFPSSFSSKSERQIVLQNNVDNQFTLKVMFPAQGGMTKDTVAQVVLQRIMDDGISSRLPSTIREKYGLVYDVSCEVNSYTDIGTFSFEATTSTENIDALLVRLAEEIRRLMDEPPSESELNRVKFRYGFDLDTLTESPSRVLNREVWNHFLGQDISAAQERRWVDELTTQDIQKTAERILKSPQSSFVLVGPKAKKYKEQVDSFWKIIEGNQS